MLIEDKHKCLKIICSVSLCWWSENLQFAETVFIKLFNKKVNKPAVFPLDYTNCKPPQILVSN